MSLDCHFNDPDWDNDRSASVDFLSVLLLLCNDLIVKGPNKRVCVERSSVAIIYRSVWLAHGLPQIQLRTSRGLLSIHDR